jgi:serine protease Do
MDALPNSTAPSANPSPPRQLPERAPGRLPLLLLLLLGVIVLAFVPTLIERIEYSRTRGEVRALQEALPQLNLKSLSKAFSLVYREVKPSVVHIDTRREIQARPSRFGWMMNDGGPQAIEETGQASGVIVDAAGYILTNLHVVDDAAEVNVTLEDGRSFPAEIVGSDPGMDLAVLKINASGLTAATWGDSDKLDVGEMVWAIGNPYGLDQTVTAGIVSAKGRRDFDGANAFKEFLQTDVAINPGSSGGPLVDVQGDVVGINSAIFGRTYQGISFAIPSNLARSVYEQIRKNGKVIRGFLGVRFKPLTPEDAALLQFPKDQPGGALIEKVTHGQPAEKAGIEPGDIIVSWNGQRVTDFKELQIFIARTEVGAKVPVKLFRNGQEMTLEAEVAERPPQAR